LVQVSGRERRQQHLTVPTILRGKENLPHGERALWPQGSCLHRSGAREPRQWLEASPFFLCHLRCGMVKKNDQGPVPGTTTTTTYQFFIRNPSYFQLVVRVLGTVTVRGRKATRKREYQSNTTSTLQIGVMSSSSTSSSSSSSSTTTTEDQRDGLVPGHSKSPSPRLCAAPTHTPWHTRNAKQKKATLPAACAAEGR
jgi:hypothetical protein